MTRETRSPHQRSLPAASLWWLRLGQRPTWLVLLIAYLLSRIVSTTLLAGSFALFSGSSIAHFDGGSSLLGFLQSWDGKYYGRIAASGYPTTLPLDASGDIAKNPWAFLPLYPLLVRTVSVIGIATPSAAVVVSVLFGYGATLALHRLLSLRFDATAARWGSFFFCFGPLSFLLQLGYAESVFLFFMFLSLGALLSRRYLLMAPLGIAAAFAHPGALALAATLGIHCVMRRRVPGDFSVAEQCTALFTVGAIFIAGVAWPVIASAVTGNSSAYFDTELAWWHDYIGTVTFIPFTPWFIFASHYWGAIGVASVVAALVAITWWLTRGSTRFLGSDLVGYTASYLAYLVAVFLPQQSMFRMLLPLSPLLGAPVLSRSPLRRRVTLAACITLQAIGVVLLWVVWPP